LLSWLWFRWSGREGEMVTRSVEESKSLMEMSKKKSWPAAISLDDAGRC